MGFELQDGMYHDLAFGLDYLWLASGFEITVEGEGDDAEEWICFTDTDGLYDAVVEHLVKGWFPLTGPETRVIRTHLGMTQSEFAARIGTTRSSVARWEATEERDRGDMRRMKEAESKPLPGTADRAVRMLVADAMGIRGMGALLSLRGFGKKKGERRIVAERVDAKWRIKDSSFGPVGGGSVPEEPRWVTYKLFAAADSMIGEAWARLAEADVPLVEGVEEVRRLAGGGKWLSFLTSVHKGECDSGDLAKAIGAIAADTFAMRRGGWDDHVVDIEAPTLDEALDRVAYEVTDEDGKPRYDWWHLVNDHGRVVAHGGPKPTRPDPTDLGGRSRRVP